MYKSTKGTKTVSDHLLDDLELRQGERAAADAVRGHLEQIFKEGVPQLTTAAMNYGFAFMSRRCAYQAKDMKTFDATSRPTVLTSVQFIQCRELCESPEHAPALPPPYRRGR